MKKEIMNLINGKEGTVRLGTMLYLHRYTKDCLGNQTDVLKLIFETGAIKDFYVSDVEIKSRDYNGVISEISDGVEKRFSEAGQKIAKDIRNGYLR